MTPLIYEMTQGDPFYAEIAFVDQYGAAVDLSTWTLGIGFKTGYADAAPLLYLSIANGGLVSVATGIIAFAFPAIAVSDIEINPRPRNGDLIPWRWIYGDLKTVPPQALEFEQADGARTPILIKLFAGIT